MIGAFLYLTSRSLRNQVLQKVRRSRSPRYLLAIAIGVAYFYFIFWRNPRHAGAGQFPLLTTGGELVIVGGLLLGAVAMWVMGGDSTALAFSQAEASFLFPAPVSRGQLVAYKLWRGQLPLLFNALIWVLLLNAGKPTLPAWARFAGLWLLFAIIYLHRLGASLVRTAWGQHGLAGVRRNLPSLGVFAVIIAGAGVSLWRVVGPLRAATGLDARVQLLSGALASAPARYVLWPFTAIIGPIFATSLGEWVRALPAALLVLAVHAWWVMHTDTAFEEAALAATAARAQRLQAMRGRRAALLGTPQHASAPGPKARSRPRSAGAARMFRLSATGHPAGAIVWKNLACLKRTAPLTQFLTLGVLSVVGGVVVGGQAAGPWGMAVGVFLAFAGILVFTGPMALRGDLRQDLQHLAGLKTLPFSGPTLVAAEILSVAIPLAILQLVSLGLAVVIAQAGHLDWGPNGLRLAIIVGGIPALVAFTGANVAIQNGTAILFPGWSRLGTAVPGGVEMMGQMVLITGLYLLLLVAMLVLPAAAGFAAIATLRLSGAAAVAVGLLAGSAMLAFELQGVLQLLGRAFEKLEPSSVSG
jgi:hypothetical protein